MTGVDTLGADNEKVTSLSPAEAWKYTLGTAEEIVMWEAYLL